MPTLNNKKINLAGQIVPYSYDDDGEVNGVMIIDDEDNEYTIHSNEMGRQLIEYLDEYVNVKGVLKKVRGEFSIVVNDFDLIEDDEYEDEADGDEDDDYYEDDDENDDWD